MDDGITGGPTAENDPGMVQEPYNPYAEIVNRNTNPAIAERPRKPVITDFHPQHQIEILHNIITHFMGSDVVDAAIARHVKAQNDESRASNQRAFERDEREYYPKDAISRDASRGNPGTNRG